MLEKERRKITRDTKLFSKAFPAFFILRLKSKKANLYLMKPKVIQVLDLSLQKTTKRNCQHCIYRIYHGKHNNNF